MLSDASGPVIAAADGSHPHGEAAGRHRWLFEPKYDGFRCILFCDNAIHLQSRRQRPLGRYSPEIIEAASHLPVKRFVFDGELIIPDQPFDTLQLRLHPAASRIRLLSRQQPAQIVVFDLLADRDGQSLLDKPFRERRAALEAMFGPARTRIFGWPRLRPRLGPRAPGWIGSAMAWMGSSPKDLDRPYQPGHRAMQKFKLWQTVDRVYDEQGRLNYVGRCGVGQNEDEIARVVTPLIGGEGFAVNALRAARATGRAMSDGQSPSNRNWWRKSAPTMSKMVVSVTVPGSSGCVMIRPPRSCTMDQLIRT